MAGRTSSKRNPEREVMKLTSTAFDPQTQRGEVKVALSRVFSKISTTSPFSQTPHPSRKFTKHTFTSDNLFLIITSRCYLMETYDTKIACEAFFLDKVFQPLNCYQLVLIKYLHLKIALYSRNIKKTTKTQEKERKEKTRAKPYK